MTPLPSFLEELLTDQQSLTAVERFSRIHNEHSPTHARLYRDLIPLEAPRPGEQYAFEVELDKCSGCKACVTACHSLNGLDDNETWRDVGLLVSPPTKPWKNIPTVQQTVTTACHHCVDPACLNGCPVLAYEKDSVTGIVRHLDDQCIGCQYCVLKCPYDVPKYNNRLGIVRKCDMCSSRLAVGEAPACVQACPNEAIRITKVNTSAVTIEFRERGKNFLSGAPGGDYTLPTTRYVGSVAASREGTDSLSTNGSDATTSRNAATRLIAADSVTPYPQPTHWPLVVMLVLSQASVGLVLLTALQPAAGAQAKSRMLWLALVLGLTGLGASVLHLGRPLGAWRAFLNLRRSWMSREIVLFGFYVPMLVATLFASALHVSSDYMLPVTALVGVLCVFCSMMLYHDTQRVLWHWQRSAPLFFCTVFILGAAAALLVGEQATPLLVVLDTALAVKLFTELLVLRTRQKTDSLKKTASLIAGRFQHAAFVRLACAMLGGIGLPLLVHTKTFPANAALLLTLAFAFLLVGELLERMLFFRTVDAPKMPGGLPT